MYDIEDLLFQIEEELKNGKKAIFGSGVTVDAEVIYAIVDKIRSSLPEVIREAKAIVKDSNMRYQADAMRAREIINDASQRANEMLAQHSIIEQAQKEANAIRAQAQDYANRLRQNVNEDLQALLSDAEVALSESLNIIAKAKNSFDPQN